MNKNYRALDVAIFVPLTAVLIYLSLHFDFFESWYYFTREHEDWELDELINVAIAVMFSATLIAVKRNKHTLELMKKLSESQDKLKTQEQEKVIRDKMAALGQLSSGMAHEINNSLQPVLGMSELLKLNTKPDDTLTLEATTLIERNALHMRNIIEQVMQVARTEENVDEEHSPIELIENATTFTATCMPSTLKTALSFEGSSKKDLSRYSTNVNKTPFLQVLTNLVTNASHACNEEGEIRIKVNLIHLNIKEAGEHAISPGYYAAIKVVDQGVGIPKSKIKDIFKPFYSCKSNGKGTGLGLAISYDYIRKWGGNISVESIEGSGTTMSFLIPLKLKNILQ